MHRLNLVSSLALLIFGALLLHSQVVTATLNGTVTDSSGGAVPSANVTVAEKSTGLARSTTTNGEGNYNMPYLKPGEYRVDVEAPGFKRSTRDNVVLDVSTVLRVDAVLTPGNLSETIEVSGAAPILKTGASGACD